MSNTHGELRQDHITGKWVAIATGRSKRPDEYAEKYTKFTDIPKYKNDCPFCNLAKFPQEPDVIRLPDDSHSWQVHIFGNKYPAFTPKAEYRTWNEGPYRAVESVGYHEVLATKYHNSFEGLTSLSLMDLQLEALVLRYRQLRREPSINYIQIIKNHGSEAGGSLEHPHHQIFTVPILPHDVADLLRGTEEYTKTHNKNPFTVMLEFEKDQQKRIVFENDHFIAFCPYASRVPFETWIMPKKEEPFFENITPNERESLAEALHQVIGWLYEGLHNPPYNYYIHSAPCDDTGFSCNIAAYQNFRWHVQILPRLSKFGGFELGTGLEINTTAPEEAAEFLRNQKLPKSL